jgi:hypothetical protein
MTYFVDKLMAPVCGSSIFFTQMGGLCGLHEWDKKCVQGLPGQRL